MAFQGSVFLLLSLIALPFLSNGEIPKGVAEKIKSINARGEHYGLVVSGGAELNVFLAKGVFQPYKDIHAVDISGRRFHVGMYQGCRTILAMSGSGSVNAAQTTQLLLTHFRSKGVIHYGRAASASPKHLRVGDVAIPNEFAHTGVWNWEDVELDKCVGKSLICLPQQPKVKRVGKASSANFYVNNVAYRNFLHTKLKVSSIDTVTAAIAMVCESEKKPFLAMSSITNYAGGSSVENDMTLIKQLWYFHARVAVGAIFEKLSSADSTLRSVTGVNIW